MIKDENTSIEDQAHKMRAEGGEDDKPTEKEVYDYLWSKGFHSTDLEISFDQQMGFWRWSASILKAIK